MKKMICKIIIASVFALMFNYSNASKLEPTLTGTYTVGGASPDYATLTAAVSALNSQGITGAVTFQIRPGTYNEQISITQFAGASASNTVTFTSSTGDSTAVILTYPSSSTSANNYTLKFDGADYVTFQKITIQRSGTNTFGNVVELSNTASNNQIKNCRIIGVNTTSTTSNYVLVYSPNTSGDNYNTFSRNAMNYGSYGFWFYGQGSTSLEQGNVFTYNILTNQSACGFDIAYQNSPQINYNRFTSGSTYASLIGIRTFYCDNALRINSNNIILSQGGTGIYLYYDDGNSQNGLTSNNFISIGGTNASIGIHVNLSTTQNIYYNSVNITNSNSSSKALNVAGLITATIDLRNNILCSGSGMAISVDDNSMSALSISNYNDLYTTGSVLGYWGTSGNKTTLADWQAASSKDANSVSCDPGFVSATDLHASSGNINGHAISLASASTPVTVDYDGTTRNASTPDIGADEFSVEDLGVSSIVFPINACKGLSGKVKVYIKNYGLYQFSGSIPVSYQISGSSVVNGNTGPVVINVGDSILFEFNTTEVFSTASVFTMNAYTSLTGDINTANNQFSNYTFEIYPFPVADAGANQSICLGDTVTLSASGGGTYEWSTLETLQSIQVIPSDTTIYYVTVTSINNCVTVDSVRIFVDDTPPPVADFTYNPTGLYVQFTNISTNSDSSYWTFGDGGWSNELSPIHLYPVSGTYTVTLIVWNNCNSDTIEQVFSVVGINDIASDNSLRFYPNPAIDKLFIDNQLKNISFIYISDISSRIVYEHPLLASVGTKIEISIGEIQAGTYLLGIIAEDVVIIKKLTIQR